LLGEWSIISLKMKSSGVYCIIKRGFAVFAHGCVKQVGTLREINQHYQLATAR